jgi:hypothetical protein
MKKIGIIIVSILVGSLFLSGCSDQKSNEQTGDFAKIHEQSDKIVRGTLFNQGSSYVDVENAIFGDRDVEIVSAYEWRITGEVTVGGTIHSYITQLQYINDNYAGTATII